MKKIYTLLAIFSISTIYAFSQCSVTVPMGAIEVHSQQKTQSNADWWVCRGGSLSLNGDSNTIYAEEGDTININGEGNYIHAKGNGKVFVSGDDNFVWYHASTVVQDNGLQTTKNKCAGAMIFAYSDTVNGCDIWAGIKNVVKSEDVLIYPNPAHDFLYVNLPLKGSDMVDVSIIDISGKIILHKNYDGLDKQLSINVADIVSGMYMIRVSNDVFDHSYKVLIE